MTCPPPRLCRPAAFTHAPMAWWLGSQAFKYQANPQTENIEVIASHVGLGLNQSAWWAVADRLAQPEGNWLPFNAKKKGRIGGLIYPDSEQRN